MAEKTEHLIAIDEVFIRFNDHFQISENSNIIFSGKFGIGKSYFLESYFKSESIEKENNAIFLSPVNYSIASNEDIFELIKVDIIQELFIEGFLKVSETQKLNKDLVYASYITSKPVSLVKHISSLFSKLSVSSTALSDISKSVEDFLKELSDYEKELNSIIVSDEKILQNFAEEKEDVKGSYLEYNLITQLIEDTLLKIKENGKQNILVLDDLDRLDPGHIFRILNVFSSHRNYKGNKFGFDKVILVCDLNNIEHIFKHIYGEHTEFEGYIDKFYSIEPFYFNNSEAMAFYIDKKFSVFLGEEALDVLRFLLIIFETTKLINLRKILKLNELPVFEGFNIKYNIALSKTPLQMMLHKIPHVNSSIDSIWFSSDDLKIIQLFRILKSLFGSYDAVREILVKHVSYPENIYNEKLITSSINLLALPRRIEKNWNTPEMFFDNMETFDYPYGTIGDYVFTIYPQWKGSNKYHGQESFFKDFRVQNNYSEKQMPWQFQNYFQELIMCFDFLRTKKLLIN